MKKLLCIIFLLIAVPAWCQELIGTRAEQIFTLRSFEEIEAIAIPAEPPARLKTSASAPCPASPYHEWEQDVTTAFPAAAIGKIFYQRNGTWWVCSGALVEPDIVITAAHCVHMYGEWARGWYFVPGYRNGSRPFGRHFAEYFWAWSGWQSQMDPRYDYAMVNLKSRPGDVTGHFGTAWNEGYYHTWLQAGYPAEYPFDGERLWYNESAFGVANESMPNPRPIWVGSPFTHGSSGGPWIIQKEDGLKVNSVNSGGFSSCGTTMQGPYFDLNFPVMLDAAKAYK